MLETLESTFSALVLELVDRHDSGSCVRKGVEVQVLSRALTNALKPRSFRYLDSPQVCKNLVAESRNSYETESSFVSSRVCIMACDRCYWLQAP